MVVFRVGLFLRFHQRAVRFTVTVSAAVAVTVASSLAVCRAASADAAPRVEVPADCGSREAFLNEVAALQRTEAARSTVSEVLITQRDDQTYELRLVSPEGSRAVVDRDCRTLFKTAAVIAATLAQSEAQPTSVVVADAPNPLGGYGETPGPAAPPASSSPDGSPKAPDQSAGDPPPALTSPVTSAAQGTSDAADARATTEPRGEPPFTALQLALGGAGFVGLSPEPHLGIEALAGLTGKRWGAHLTARLLPPRSMLTGDGLGLRETVWGARLSASHQADSWLRISLGLSGYWISAQGLGISDPTTDSVGLLAPELELAASVLVQPTFRAEIGLQGRVGITQPRFQVETGQVVYELPRLGGAGVLRILWTRQ